MTAVTPHDSRILVLDDEDTIRTLLVRILGRHGYDCVAVGSAAEARRRLEAERFALLLSDLRLPGESGADLAAEVVRDHPDTAVVMVTGVDDRALAEEALEHGAYAYVLKPFRTNELLINVAGALRRRALELETRNQRERLEQTVLQRTATLRETIARLERSEAEARRLREETVRRLAWAAEFRNQETGDHIARMSLYCALLARLAGLDVEHAERLRIASPMHDVGKIGIPDRILLKPGPLTPEERQVMEAHTEIGFRMLSGSGIDLLDLAALLALTHHERVDGSGYPRGLAGDEIPLEGRIAAIGDVFDALTSDRAYRPAFTPEEARELMQANSGTHFDPVLLELFFAAWDEVLAIRQASTGGRPELALVTLPRSTQ
ncbi:MAG TPA: HD domain-containing phosphohydrolase [Gaiellaceae bacterium]|nr:HD domain-containing phosphohydrolase [Gaiellaceae bacterium]